MLIIIKNQSSVDGLPNHAAASKQTQPLRGFPQKTSASVGTRGFRPGRRGLTLASSVILSMFRVGEHTQDVNIVWWAGLK
jgi:hypothetical protein